jgi:hypothetical protein
LANTLSKRRETKDNSLRDYWCQGKIFLRMKETSQVGRCTPVIPALRRLRQEDLGFQISLCYILRPCLRKPKEGKK